MERFKKIFGQVSRSLERQGYNPRQRVCIYAGAMAGLILGYVVPYTAMSLATNFQSNPIWESTKIITSLVIGTTTSSGTATLGILVGIKIARVRKINLEEK